VTGYQPPRLLEPTDDLDGFVCRSSEQTTWLRRHARQSAATGTTRVSVVTQGHAKVHVVQSRVAFGDGTGPAGSVGRAESALRSGVV